MGRCGRGCSNQGSLEEMPDLGRILGWGCPLVRGCVVKCIIPSPICLSVSGFGEVTRIWSPLSRNLALSWPFSRKDKGQGHRPQADPILDSLCLGYVADKRLPAATPHTLRDIPAHKGHVQCANPSGNAGIRHQGSVGDPGMGTRSGPGAGDAAQAGQRGLRLQ